MKKFISARETDSILFNLDSMRTKLLNQRDDAFYTDSDLYDKYQERIDEIESILSAMNYGKLTTAQLKRAREIVAERQYQRYVTCLNAGLSE